MKNAPQPSSDARPPELDPVTLRRARRGDEPAVRSVVERYHRPVRALVYRMLEPAGRGDRTEDIVQETFLRVTRALPRFAVDGPARPSTWILTIATRLALNELRRPRPVVVPLDAARSVAAGDAADGKTHERQLRDVLGRALEALSPEFRAVLLLRAVHGLEYGEIARTLSVDVGTVKSRLSRARAAIRRAIEDNGHD